MVIYRYLGLLLGYLFLLSKCVVSVSKECFKECDEFFIKKCFCSFRGVSSANVSELILDFWCSPTSIMSLSIFATKAGPHSAMDTMRANMVGLNN